MVKFNRITNKVPFYEFFRFSIEEIAQMLEYMGLMNSQESCQVESLDKYIFIHGDEQEVYNSEERNFIKSVGNIYIYREFYKKINRGTMPCRIIAAEINAANEIKNALFFMKEINKAIGGFTIFVIKANTRYYMGIRAFNKDIKDDCIISRPIESFEDFEDISDKLSYVPQTDDFMDYYVSLAEALEYDRNYIDYDTKVMIKRGIQHSYLDTLNEISRMYKVSFEYEIDRYYSTFENIEERDYLSVVKEAVSELSFIKTFKANTIEMIFEAEKMVQLAIKEEEEYETFMEKHHTNNAVNIKGNVSEMKEYLDDPELIIKILKQQRGI